MIIAEPLTCCLPPSLDGNVADRASGLWAGTAGSPTESEPSELAEAGSASCDGFKKTAYGLALFAGELLH